MHIQPVKFTLLNHLFYHTEISSGSVTGAFLGDLALTYAFQKALHQSDTLYEHRLMPDYQEIANFDMYITVAKPVSVKAEVYKTTNRPKRTESYTRNTLFNTDGFYDKASIEKSGKSPFKNLIHVQGIAVQNMFIALLLSKKQMDVPNTVRIGNQKETLVEVQPIELSETDDDFWLNIFTLKSVFNNLDTAVEILQEKGKMNYHYILENYNLMKHFTASEVKQIFS